MTPMSSTDATQRAKTEQERFWEGDFGDDYTDRNIVTVEARQPFFRKIMELAPDIKSVCEFGANKGHNLLSLKATSPALQLNGIEINPKAFEELNQIDGVSAHHTSIQDFAPNQQYDLTFTCGVLIHVNPDDLPVAYDKLYNLSDRYILINEYYNPSPVELNYRGHGERLFKRDFAGEFLDRFGDKVRVVDYGFLWARQEPTWDNTTWVLIEKLS